MARAMTRLSGTATGVRTTVSVRGDRDGVSTSHYTFFKLGDITVRFTSSAPAVIGEGDQLVVAGKLRGRMLLAEAYLNRTATARGDAGLWANLAGTIFCFLLGGVGLGWALFWPLLFGGADIDTWLLVLLAVAGLVFCGFGTYSLRRWLHIRAAVKLIKSG
jgi:hypothetical protein